MKPESTMAQPFPDIVHAVRDALLDRLPDDICLIILYGSEARGEARPDSDVDLMVVLRHSDPESRSAVQDAVYDVMWERDFDRLISVYVLPADQFEGQRRRGFSFIRSVERDGVVLWQAA